MPRIFEASMLWKGRSGGTTITSNLFNIYIYTIYITFYIKKGLKGFWGQPLGPNFPSPWATMLALRLDCSTAALTTPQKVLPFWKLVELKMLDFSGRTRTGISILTSAADYYILYILYNIYFKTRNVCQSVYLLILAKLFATFRLTFLRRIAGHIFSLFKGLWIVISELIGTYLRKFCRSTDAGIWAIKFEQINSFY